MGICRCMLRCKATQTQVLRKSASLQCVSVLLYKCSRSCCHRSSYRSSSLNMYHPIWHLSRRVTNDSKYFITLKGIKTWSLENIIPQCQLFSRARSMCQFADIICLLLVYKSYMYRYQNTCVDMNLFLQNKMQEKILG